MKLTKQGKPYSSLKRFTAKRISLDQDGRKDLKFMLEGQSATNLAKEILKKQRLQNQK